MKHLRPFVLEQALITRKGKQAFADKQPLRDVSGETLAPNIVLAHFVQANFMMAAGKFWLYFIDEPGSVSIEKLNSGEADLFQFPQPVAFGRAASPITDVWKKTHTKRFKGAEHILGALEGYANDSEIFIAMMSVRPEFKRNRINSYMIDALVRKFPSAQLVFEAPTEDGVAYIKGAYPEAKIKWKNNYRPKNWDKENDRPL